MVSENDDSPGLGTELSTPVLAASHIQMFSLSESVLASLVELPALEMPGGGVAPGMRVLIQYVDLKQLQLFKYCNYFRTSDS